MVFFTCSSASCLFRSISCWTSSSCFFQFNSSCLFQSAFSFCFFSLNSPILAFMVYWTVLALCRELVWIQHSVLQICIQKSGIRLGLVCLSFKEVRSYFRKASGVDETCGCG